MPEVANLGDRLAHAVQRFQAATGEQSMIVVIEKHDGGMAVHQVGFEPQCGLLIEGKPPTIAWWQEADDFHPLQWPPSVLH